MPGVGEVCKSASGGLRIAALIVVLVACPSAASAQDWTWAMRVTTGVTTPTGSGADLDPATHIDVGIGPHLTVDVIRSLECNLEFVASGIMALHTPVNVIVAGRKISAGSIAPSGVQIGLAFKPCQRSWGEVYVGPLVGGFERDRTDPIDIDGVRRSFSIPGGWGIGALAGYRRNVSDRWGLDVAMRWQRYRAPLGDSGHITVNPLVVTGGVIVRF